MKKHLGFLSAVLLAILSACSSPATSSPETTSEPPQELTSPASTYYPLDTITQIEEIDLILAAVASGDAQAVRDLFGFSTIACKTVVNALGGPPPCRAGEKEETKVEVLPFLGSEGSYLRKDEVNNFPGLNVTGVYAIYQVSATAYSEENFPKGDYGIMLTSSENLPNIVLQIKNGQIVRIDYVFDPSSAEAILQRDAANFVLPPKLK